MKRILILTCLAGALLTAGSLCAAGTVKSDIPADLARQAKVSLETARATALAKVPNGTVKSEELEKEHGKLIYSFDIQVPGKSGIEEVNVDAIDGKVLGVEHESARTERREKAKEHKEHHPPGH
jgi:hypothetical protein